MYVTQVWDLLDRSHEASVVKSVSSSALQSMAFFPSKAAQQLLAVGDGQGVLHILEMPRNLRRPLANEKEATARFFDREIARVEYVLSTKVRVEPHTWRDSSYDGPRQTWTFSTWKKG